MCHSNLTHHCSHLLNLIIVYPTSPSPTVPAFPLLMLSSASLSLFVIYPDRTVSPASSSSHLQPDCVATPTPLHLPGLTHRCPCLPAPGAVSSPLPQPHCYALRHLNLNYPSRASISHVPHNINELI
jgi:hypothetical protein